MWKSLWPGTPVKEIPIGHVTNGVHLPTWVNQELGSLYDRYLGSDWRERQDDPKVWSKVASIPADTVLNGLKTYLVQDRIDQVAFSFTKHLATYATGRSLTYNETEYLREQGKKLRSNDYRMQDMIKIVVQSNLFLKK